MVVLMDRYARCVSGNLSVRKDAVNGDRGLRGPGQCWCQRERGGVFCSSSHHLTFRAHLEKQKNNIREELYFLHPDANFLAYCGKSA